MTAMNGADNHTVLYRVREIAEILGVYRSDVTRMIERGALPAVKDPVSGHWMVDLGDAKEQLKVRLEIADIKSIAEERRVLEAAREQLRRERATFLRDRQVEVIDLLRAVPLDEAIDVLASIDVDRLPPAASRKVLAKLRELEEVADRRDNPPLEERPDGVPERAQFKLLGTGIGRIAIWHWRTPKGFRAMHGGPRPGAIYFHAIQRSAIKMATQQARYEYGKIARVVSTRTRFLVLKRDGYACRYCGQKPPAVVLHVDHVVPLSAGGSNELDNLVTACDECNQGKANLE